MTQSLPNPLLNQSAGYLLPLDSPHASLALAGGKGLNLAHLARKGFTVPPGFLITTHAYRHFIEQNGLRRWITEQIRAICTGHPDELDVVSERIRARFRATAIPPEIASVVLENYQALGSDGAPIAVAVRSSATAEDLPEFSFAGQQDTFLNVQGDDALLEAVLECWSSLWTARAIGYRIRNGIDHEEIALAVVVQKMVQSEVSGVLFTANPLNGRRTETVIDATFGLGEALVGGLVEPDHFVVDTATGRVLDMRLGTKATVIRGLPGGGTTTVHAPQADVPTLTDRALEELTCMGKAVAELYGSPQDIEWAYAGGQCYLLQSRAITSLYPLPERRDTEELRVYLSFGALQGVLAPLTPLGQDTIKTIFTGGAHLFGYHDATLETQGVLHTAGSRLWIDITNLLRNGLGRKFIRRVLPVADPGSIDTLQSLSDDPRLQPQAKAVSRATIARVRPVLWRIVKTLVWSLLYPDRSRRAVYEQVEAIIAHAKSEARSVNNLAEWIDFHQRFCRGFFFMLIPQFVPRLMAGYLSLNLLYRLATRLETVSHSNEGQAQPEARIDGQTALDLTRGLSHNVTTEMDLALWQVVQTVRQDAEALDTLRDSDPQTLAEQYLNHSLPLPVQAAVGAFLARYGMRGVAEIDFGRPRWQEAPAPLFRTLQSYLAIDDTEMAPDAVFRRGETVAALAIERLSRTARLRWGKPGEVLVRALAHRVRALAGLRESPKFTMINLIGISRDILLRHGQTWVTEVMDGTLDLQPDDLFMLHINELRVLATGAPGDWTGLVSRRRATLARESQRQPIPRVLLSDGLTIYEGMGAEEDTDGAIVGSPVSAGVVEGRVRVVFDPSHADLEPGEILVCPGTDPAWTPLFLVAGGLVMEVGGLMTHGSVVAREYGIPAVVGVDRATERLETGQRVRVDGTHGRVLKLENGI